MRRREKTVGLKVATEDPHLLPPVADSRRKRFTMIRGPLAHRMILRPRMSRQSFLEPSRCLPAPPTPGSNNPHGDGGTAANRRRGAHHGPRDTYCHHRSAHNRNRRTHDGSTYKTTTPRGRVFCEQAQANSDAQASQDHQYPLSHFHTPWV